MKNLLIVLSVIIVAFNGGRVFEYYQTYQEVDVSALENAIAACERDK